MITTDTDAPLNQLGWLPKNATNPSPRWSEKPTRHPAHRQCVFQAAVNTADGRDSKIWHGSDLWTTYSVSGRLGVLLRYPAAKVRRPSPMLRCHVTLHLESYEAMPTT